MIFRSNVAWCSKAREDGIYHQIRKYGYGFTTACGLPFSVLEWQWRAADHESVTHCEDCINQHILEELGE